MDFSLLKCPDFERDANMCARHHAMRWAGACKDANPTLPTQDTTKSPPLITPTSRKQQLPDHDQAKIDTLDRLDGFTLNTTHTLHATQFRDAWVPHTRTQRYGILAMTIRP